MVGRRLGWPAFLPAASVVALALLGACGSSGVGIGACRQVEEARCRRAPVCGVPLDTPVFTSGTSVDACIQYYDDACLHGLQAADPPAASVNACVSAINNACAFVQSPQNSAACAWLIPPSEADASSVAEASTAADAAPADANGGSD